MDLDTTIPNPFFMAVNKIEAIKNSYAGIKMNRAEDVLICNGDLRLPSSYKDIFYSNPKNQSKEKNDLQKLTYYVGNVSFAHDFDNLKDNLEYLKDNKIFHLAFLLPDINGVTPIEKAINQNSAKTLEIILNSLVEIKHFNVSRSLYQHFPKLFETGLKSFENYLKTCYFETFQMVTLNKLRVSNTEVTRHHNNCAVLGLKFFNKYGIHKNQRKVESVEQEEE